MPYKYKFTRRIKMIVPSIILGLMMSACAVTSNATAEHGDVYADVKAFDETANASAQVDAALKQARDENKLALIVLGTDLCHDSRAFAGNLAEPRFTPMLTQSYVLLYVDVGRKDRNVDIAQRFGLDMIEGTPTVFVISPDGKVLNLATAPGWRNAASRSQDEIYTYLDAYAKEQGVRP